MGKKFVVIGSNSFSGSHFVNHLIQSEFEVIGISRSPEPNSIFLPYKKQLPSNFKFYQFDLNHDLGDIFELIQRFSPEYIVNFAGQGMVAESWQNPEHWFQTNVVATVKLHDKLRKLDFLKKYVHISTPEVYGSCSGKVSESVSYHPSTPYAVSRAAADMSLMSFFHAYRFPVVFTRAANVYGPGQQLYRIIPRTILFFLSGKKLQLHGGGNSVRSFIHIQDVADATLRIALEAPAGEIYHIATESAVSIRSLVEMIAELMDVSFKDNVEISGDRLGKDAAYLLDTSKLRKEFDWKETIDLRQGIVDTIAWIKDNLSVIKQQPMEYIHHP